MDGPSFHDERFVRDVAREIAREVARDSHEAEDLAQEAWLRSLTHPPRHWAFPKAWMRQVAKRIAIKRHRSEDARREREVRHVGPAGEPDAPELLAKLEVARELRRALRALDPLDRRILLLRYVEDEPPRRIAKALGMPVETVRSRIKRALPKLREKLQRGGRGSSSWLSSLLVVFSPRPRWSTRWISLGAGTLVVGAALVPLALRAPEREPELAGAPPAAGERTVALGEARREALATPTPPSAAPERAASLRVALRWAEDGRPASDVRVRLEPLELSGALVGTAFGGPATREARSGSDGRCALDALEPGAWRVVPALGPSRALRLEAGETAELALELPRGLALRGRVVLPDGAPAPQAEVWLSWPERPQECALVARADGEGRFALAAVDPGCWIGAGLGGWQDTLHHALRDPRFRAEDGALEVELALFADPRFLTGRVVDESGRPVAGAEVEVQLDEPSSEKPHEPRTCLRLHPAVRTDADGRYAFAGLHRSRYALVASASGFAPSVARVAAFAKSAAEAPPERIVLRPGRTLSGRLTTRAGAPAVGARVELHLAQWFRTRVTLADARGEYRFDDLPGCRLEPRAVLRSGPEAGEDELVGACGLLRRGERDERWNAVLDDTSTLAGRALDAAGAPLVGWSVRAQAAGGADGVDDAGEARECVSDAQGRFAFAGCDARPLRLELFAPGERLPRGRVEGVRAGTPALELRAETSPSALGGWLVGAPRGASLWLVRADEPELRHELALEGHEQAFAADALLPGAWRLELWEEARWSRRLAELELARGEARELGAVLAGEDGTLAVRLPDGLPPQDVLLREAGAHGRVLVESWRMDAERWARWSLPPGDYELRLGGTREATTTLREHVEPGATVERVADFGELHTLVLELQPASPAEAGRDCWLELVDEAGVARIQRALTLAAGLFEVELALPSGRYALRLAGGGHELLARELVVRGPERVGPLRLASTQLPR